LLHLIEGSEEGLTTLRHPSLNNRVSQSSINFLTLTTTTESEFIGEMEAVLIWRTFLSLLPIAVFENPDAPCRGQVKDRMLHLLGEEPAPQEVDAMVKVVKRLQRYGAGGRTRLNASSFDIDSAIHQKLLKSQKCRCAVCGYFFREIDLDPYQEESEVDLDEEETDGLNAHRLASNPKKACLDHILPIYLAGDRQSNWQVLCKECNAGKSDLLMGFEAREWFGHLRLKKIKKLTTSLRYMALKRNSMCSDCFRGPRQVGLAIERKDKHAPFYYWNLKTKCEKCRNS
jgi:5-methylcytosine-specific restriction endonuclease McrA